MASISIRLEQDKEKEKKRRRSALLISLLIALSILLWMYFTRIIFPEQEPEFSYGMEVSYGLDDQGGGSETIPIEEIYNDAEDLENDPNENSDPNQEAVEDVATSDISDSPLPDTKKKQEQDKRKQQEEKEKTTTKGSGNTTGSGEGNDDNATGKKGNENGIDKRGLYEGKGGTGANANIAGWRWEAPPQVRDNSRETGTITFKVKVDADGYVFDAKVIAPTTVSRSVVAVYEQEVYNLIFVPTADNASPPPVSSGTITFIIKSR